MSSLICFQFFDVLCAAAGSPIPLHCQYKELINHSLSIDYRLSTHLPAYCVDPNPLICYRRVETWGSCSWWFAMGISASWDNHNCQCNLEFIQCSSHQAEVGSASAYWNGFWSSGGVCVFWFVFSKAQLRITFRGNVIGNGICNCQLAFCNCCTLSPNSEFCFFVSCTISLVNPVKYMFLLSSKVAEINIICRVTPDELSTRTPDELSTRTHVHNLNQWNCQTSSVLRTSLFFYDLHVRIRNIIWIVECTWKHQNSSWMELAARKQKARPNQVFQIKYFDPFFFLFQTHTIKAIVRQEMRHSNF